MPRRYQGATRTVRADQLQPGQVVVADEHNGPMLRRGRWPVVARVKLDPHDGAVVILADRDGALYLYPHSMVEIATDQDPGPRPRTIRADQVKVGMTITDAGNTLVRQRRGRWPTVTRVEHRRLGEDNRPTVYLELSDRRGASIPLGRADAVTVLDNET